MTVDQMAGPGEQASPRQKSPGTTSLVLGTTALAMFVCPLLAIALPMQVRLLLACSIVPLGISAIVSGTLALRRVRGRRGTDLFRARAGITIGTAALLVPRAIWALNQARH
ncbi:hypothetical protein [Streptomyces sp. NPDC055099]